MVGHATASYSLPTPACQRSFSQLLRLSSDLRSDLLLLAQVDGAVVRLECGFRAAAVDGAGDGAVHLHLEFAIGRIVLLGDGSAAEFEIEVAIDFSVIGAQFYVGLEVRRKSHIDLPIHAAEGERLVRVHGVHGDLYRAVHGDRKSTRLNSSP